LDNRDGKPRAGSKGQAALAIMIKNENGIFIIRRSPLLDRIHTVFAWAPRAREGQKHYPSPNAISIPHFQKPNVQRCIKTRILKLRFRKVGVFPLFNRSDRATAEKPESIH